jgi:hypothetical protein
MISITFPEVEANCYYTAFRIGRAKYLSEPIAGSLDFKSR